MKVSSCKTFDTWSSKPFIALFVSQKIINLFLRIFPFFWISEMAPTWVGSPVQCWEAPSTWDHSLSRMHTSSGAQNCQDEFDHLKRWCQSQGSCPTSLRTADWYSTSIVQTAACEILTHNSPGPVGYSNWSSETKASLRKADNYFRIADRIYMCCVRRWLRLHFVSSIPIWAWEVEPAQDIPQIGAIHPKAKHWIAFSLKIELPPKLRDPA